MRGTCAATIRVYVTAEIVVKPAMVLRIADWHSANTWLGFGDRVLINR
jgi:hypothetical protein